jgi:hypothetical protein
VALRLRSCPWEATHRPKTTACSKCLSQAQTTDSWRAEPVRPHFFIMT